MRVYAIKVSRSESGSGKWGWVGSTQEDYLDVYASQFDTVPSSKNVFEVTFDQVSKTWMIVIDGENVPIEIYVPKDCVVAPPDASNIVH